MMRKAEPQRAYTDAPLLHTNLFVGSFQLLFWLFFHPSAWRHQVARIDPTLPPDFCLAVLSRRQWRQAAFWRLLLMTYLVWPFLTGAVVGMTVRLLGRPLESMVLGVTIGVSVGIVISVAASIAGNLPVGVAIGIAVTLVVGLGSSLAFGTVGGVSVQATEFSFDLAVSTIIGLAGGLAGGLAFGVAAGLRRSTQTVGATISLARQVSGVIIGILIGVGAGIVAGSVNGRLAEALVVGIPFGLALGWRTQRWRRGVWSGVLVGVVSAFSGSLAEAGITGGILSAITLIILISSLFALPYVLAERIAGSSAGALAGALGSGGGFFLFVSSGQLLDQLLLFSLVGVLLGLTLAWWRPVVLYPFLAAWNILLLRLDERRLRRGRSSLLRWHSAFWDEFQRLPLISLDNHLLLLLHHRPHEGARAMTYLSTSRQRWAAQAAQIELDALSLAACDTVTAIGEAYQELAAGELTGPASALLRSFSRISQDVEAAQRQESAYNQRLALRAVEDRLDGLLRELTRSNEPYAVRFQPIAAQWRHIVAAQGRRLAEEAEMRQEIDSPYIIGVPLTEKQEIFVGRHQISARIEQLLLDRRQPPLFLYGQRRVGKTSLLNNLGRLLPTTVIPMFVDLQGPASRAKNDAGFLYNIARSMVQSAEKQRGFVLPSLTREALAVDPYTQFDEWLDKVERTLGERMALLMLDEFEVLDDALTKGRFDEVAVLGMLRHLIQHRSRFKILISGSHTLDEFQRWASYLINVQVIHIGYLSEDEARQLIECPVQDFALRYEPAASAQVLALTRGHPFLIQLLCADIVALKNEQPPTQRRLARLADVETAVEEALNHGSFFFADIKRNQVDAAGLAVLHQLAPQAAGTAVSAGEGETAVSDLPQVLTQLQQQELIEPCPNGYRFQVELVRRWFAQQL